MVHNKKEKYLVKVIFIFDGWHLSICASTSFNLKPFNWLLLVRMIFLFSWMHGLSVNLLIIFILKTGKSWAFPLHYKVLGTWMLDSSDSFKKLLCLRSHHAYFFIIKKSLYGDQYKLHVNWAKHYPCFKNCFHIFILFLFVCLFPHPH